MILACNDDGIQSEGLARLVRALEGVDQVAVVAPDRERSAAGHALTLNRPLRADEVKPGWYSVDGTPTDCVQLALNGLLTEKPWMVVSGINRGFNLGDDVTYSGTVCAAMEAVLLGVPAVAFSQGGRADFQYGAIAGFARTLVSRFRDTPMPPDTLLSVNAPEEQATGYVITRQGKRRFGSAIVEKTDPRGRKYYWIGGEELDFYEEPGTDFAAVSSGLISVTPLHLDLTNYESTPALEALEIRWP